MEHIVHNGDLWISFQEHKFIVRVHVTGDSLHCIHPFISNEGKEIFKCLLLLAVGKVDDGAVGKVYDDGGIDVSAVNLEFIDSYVFRLLFRFEEMASAISVQCKQPGLVYGLHDVGVDMGED